MAGALAGIRVVDLSTHLSGPYCTMLLGDMGADVVKVEWPGGDEARALPPFVDGRSLPFDLWNRNKRSIVLDAQDEADRTTFRALLAGADVVVENGRPGMLARMGLPWEAMHAAHPRLILASISGYGRAGPLAGQGACDVVAQGLSGLMAADADGQGAPRPLPVPVCDLVAGMQCCIGILGALAARGAGAGGQRVEASLLSAGLSLGIREAAHLLAPGGAAEEPVRAGRGDAPAFCVRAADGWMTVCAARPQAWGALCGILDSLELLEDARFATDADRTANGVALLELLAPRFAPRPRAEWLALFEAAGIPAGPVLSQRDALAQAQGAGTGIVADLPGTPGPRPMLATPFGLSATPPSIRRPAPALGEHGAEIRAELMDGRAGRA
ncbi:CaiB/BaiF CoA transferase family protein [Falsiroseomonas sp. CW058]|uniref:CaiB/BaiF CoA transferase family protein n=1 Tax=Falsiroseomonas sp. CW058 TaxID=3388664 RepID=UPI003D31290D